jgi:hypothetical protein
MNSLSYFNPYDTFNRYITLSNIINSHEGKFSEEDAAEVLGSVEANTITMAEGAIRPLPINTIWNAILDLTDRSLKMKFFIKKGPIDSATGEETLIFAPYLSFRMKNTSMQRLGA